MLLCRSYKSKISLFIFWVIWSKKFFSCMAVDTDFVSELWWGGNMRRSCKDYVAESGTGWEAWEETKLIRNSRKKTKKQSRGGWMRKSLLRIFNKSVQSHTWDIRYKAQIGELRKRKYWFENQTPLPVWRTESSNASVPECWLTLDE